MKVHPTLSRRTVLASSAALLGGAFASVAHAQQAPINTLRDSVFGGRTDTAINGYDAVAYFTQNKPVRGRDAFSFTWMEARWKFDSQANLDLFKGDPTRYAPQYGGYCAFGVAKGSLVKVEPEQFTIVDGKLYLNFDASVQAQWLKERERFVREANVRFPELLKR